MVSRKPMHARRLNHVQMLSELALTAWNCSKIKPTSLIIYCSPLETSILRDQTVLLRCLVPVPDLNIRHLDLEYVPSYNTPDAILFDLNTPLLFRTRIYAETACSLFTLVIAYQTYPSHNPEQT